MDVNHAAFGTASSVATSNFCAFQDGTAAERKTVPNIDSVCGSLKTVELIRGLFSYSLGVSQVGVNSLIEDVSSVIVWGSKLIPVVVL